MTERKYQVISADGHMEPPPEDWEPWVPQKYKNRAPRMLKLENGGEAWTVEGLPLIPVGPEAQSGNAPEHHRRTGNSYWEADGVTRRALLGNGVQRLHEQDLDGIDAEVLYPPFFVNKLIRSISDNHVYLAMVQAYNTWLAEGFCAVAPDRLIGVASMPVTGIDDAIAELKRCKQLGYKCVDLQQWPSGSGHYTSEDDRFFAAILEEDMRLTPHIHFGDPITKPKAAASTLTETPDNPDRPLYAFRPQPGRICTDNIIAMIHHGVFDRFPDLKIYFAETQAGWVPYWLQMMEQVFADQRIWYGASVQKSLRDYVRDHIIFGFIRDPLAVQNAHQWDGLDNLLWGSDMPHGAATFPFSREWLDRSFVGMDDELRRRVLVEHFCEYLGIDADKPITPTPAGGPYPHPELGREAPFYQNERGVYVDQYA